MSRPPVKGSKDHRLVQGLMRVIDGCFDSYNKSFFHNYFTLSEFRFVWVLSEKRTGKRPITGASSHCPTHEKSYKYQIIFDKDYHSHVPGIYMLASLMAELTRIFVNHTTEGPGGRDQRIKNIFARMNKKGQSEFGKRWVNITGRPRVDILNKLPCLDLDEQCYVVRIK